MGKDKEIQLIDRASVCKLLNISNSTLWRLEKSKNFIPKVYLSSRRVAYERSAVKEWIESKTL